MSKTIETLKRSSLKGDVLDNHIANTYFYQKARPKIRKKKAHSYFKSLVKLTIPVSVAVAILALIAITAPVLREKHHAFIRNSIANARIIKIVDKGSVNKDIIDKYEFRGSAKKDASKTTKDALVLTTPKKYNWADVAMYFSFPLNLTNRSLSLSLRGNVGGERVSIVLRDTSNKSYRISDLYLSSNWSDKVIRLDNIKHNIDLANIDHIRIESGCVGESSVNMDSPIDVTVFIKNINIIKEMRT